MSLFSYLMEECAYILPAASIGFTYYHFVKKEKYDISSILLSGYFCSTLKAAGMANSEERGIGKLSLAKTATTSIICSSTVAILLATLPIYNVETNKTNGICLFVFGFAAGFLRLIVNADINAVNEDYKKPLIKCDTNIVGWCIVGTIIGYFIVAIC
eukprot:UN01046